MPPTGLGIMLRITFCGAYWRILKLANSGVEDALYHSRTLHGFAEVYHPPRR